MEGVFWRAVMTFSWLMIKTWKWWSGRPGESTFFKWCWNCLEQSNKWTIKWRSNKEDHERLDPRVDRSEGYRWTSSPKVKWDETVDKQLPGERSEACQSIYSENINNSRPPWQAWIGPKRIILIFFETTVDRITRWRFLCFPPGRNGALVDTHDNNPHPIVGTVDRN